jgi:Carboxypeptidase regulatory-like domain
MGNCRLDIPETPAAMKYAFTVLLGFLLAVCLRAQINPAASDAAADKETCSVSGTVVRRDTGEPLSKAKISLVTHENWDDSVFDITDSQGHFLLDALPCASYLLTASHPGFVDAGYGQRKQNDPGAVLTLAPGQKMTGLVFKLQRTGVITGRVFDENGELVQGAIVRVLRPTGRGKRQRALQVGTGLSNDLGEFRIYDLSPGRYYLAVNYHLWSAREGFDPKPKHRLLFKKGYPTTYFPNTTDPSKAQTVTLNAGDELTSIDFRLELVAMNTVSGRILNPPAANTIRGSIDIYMNSRGSGLLDPDSIDTRAVANDGTFVLQRVPPGSYNIHALYADRDTGERVWVVRQLEVTGADVEGITLAFMSGNLIKGHVNWEGGKQEDFSTLMVFLSPTDENSPLIQKRSEVRPDGSLLFRNVNEGEYRPWISAPNTDCYVKSARVGKTAMADGKVAIHSGADNSLEVAVSCHASHVEGQVLTSDSLPAAGVFVVLVPESQTRDQSSAYAEARTDQNGHFVLKGIKPGDYKLFSWDAVEDGEWYDSDFLRPFEEKGVSAHLEEGDRKRIDLTLIETSPNSSSKP